ncbi:MAG: zinc ABC transporter substrate-binding protein [Phycisphaerales bacterium]|nr:zinc ABC transporter substrate-binding protein [Phycisphaerales bacterium]
MSYPKHRLLLAWLAIFVPAASPSAASAAEPIRIVATTPDLGSLAREVGGDDVAVTVLAKGGEDPHFLEAKPSFIKAASDADLFIQTGMELEMGWAPPIITNSRNARIQPGAPGNLDASNAITPLEVPTGSVDRSMGDVHAAGNPHYLTDPINGLRVATLIAARLGELSPDHREAFQEHLAAFRTRLGADLVGDKLAAKYDFEKLATLEERGRLLDFLKSQNDADALGGWFGALRDAGMLDAPVKAVADHNLWPYFARRFNIEVVGFLEPKPGVPPTTRHLQDVIGEMKDKGVHLVLSTVYFDPRHAAFVARQTGAGVAELAHMPGARPGADDYLAMCDYNIRTLIAAAGGSR